MKPLGLVFRHGFPVGGEDDVTRQSLWLRRRGSCGLLRETARSDPLHTDAEVRRPSLDVLRVGVPIHPLLELADVLLGGPRDRGELRLSHAGRGTQLFETVPDHVNDD